MMFLSLIPAFGRDYKTAKACLADWLADKDFVIACIGHPYDGKPANRSSFSSREIEKITLRFNRQTKMVKAK